MWRGASRGAARQTENMILTTTVPMKTNTAISLSLVVLVGCLAVWLRAIRAAQLAPHRITQSINGHVFNSFMATNPAYVVAESSWRIGTNGPEIVTTYHTNYYWHISPLFR